MSYQNDKQAEQLISDLISALGKIVSNDTLWNDTRQENLQF